MKLNWGKSLLLVYVAYMIAMLSLVYASTTYKVNLVSPSYYQDALDYEGEIEAQQNTLNLQEKVTIKVDGQKINIQLPTFDGDIKGDVVLYRPSDSQLDQKFPLAVSDANTMSLSTKGLKKGAWKVKLKWESAGKHYQFEDAVFL